MTEAAGIRGTTPTASSASGARRGSVIQALIDIGALFFAALFVCLFGLAVAVAMFILLFVNLKF